jgi:hypothetical protein
MGDYRLPTPEEFAQWLTPGAALMRVGAHFGDPALAERAIDGRLKGGRIRAATLRLSTLPGPGWIYVIPPNQWEHLAADSADWWQTGDIRIAMPSNGRDGGGTYRHFDVRLDPADVAMMLAGAAPRLQPAIPPSPAASKAGRPCKEFWDELVIATMKAVWDGDFAPVSQAELERWMLDWASRHGHGIGETSVKAPARKIWAARAVQKMDF